MLTLPLLLCLTLRMDFPGHLEDDRESPGRVMLDVRNPLSQRTVAAQKLAALGDPRSLPVFLEACQSSCVIDRLNGNKGLAQLTGKNLMNFGGYQASEGTAMVSGCVLLTRLGYLSRLSHTTNYLHRPAALKAYLEWLSAERPEWRDWMASSNSTTSQTPAFFFGFETVGPRETIR